MRDVTTRRRWVRRVGTDPERVACVEHRGVVADDGLGVVLVHGAGSDLDAPVLVALADVVARAGHVALRVNLGYRQARPSGPPPRAEASIADLEATLDTLARHDGTRSWVIGGSSYGGRVATMLASRRHDLAGVLCCSYPLHPPRHPDRLRVAHFPAVTVPVLVVQGTDDPFGGADELRPHLAELGGTSRVVTVQGGDHGLHVPRTRAPDGATHRVADVVGGVSAELTSWLADRAPDRASN